MRNISIEVVLLLTLVASSASGSMHRLNVSRIGDNWGTNIHFTTPPQAGEVAMLAKAFKIARTDFTWAAVEHTCGQYDFSAYEKLMSVMKEHNVRPYWILDYGNPHCYPPRNSTPSNACNTAQCIAAYGQFAKAAAEHFRGNGTIWESVNEPNGMGHGNATDIVALCKSAGPHFHRLGEMFVGPTTSGIPVTYLLDAFKSGLLTAPLWGVSVHPYREYGPETAILDLKALRDSLDDLFDASDVPILNGEWGYTSAKLPCNYGDRVSSVEVQGKYVPRMWLSALIAGSEISIDYDWHDDGPSPTACEQNFGSVYNAPTHNETLPFLPKPAYHAAHTIQRTIGNAKRFVGTVKGDPFVAFYIAQFEAPHGGAWFAVWHTLGDFSERVSFRVEGESSRCWRSVGTFGDDLGRVCAVNGTVSVNATDGPMYLV